jgi:uncharacterized protein (TIGR03083 family)
MPDPFEALRASQQRLATMVDDFGDSDLERPSYDEGWSIADVLSHLGSQAEIFSLFVDAGLEGTAPPSNEAFGPLWEEWNAKSSTAKAADSLAADAAFLDRLEGLGEDELAAFELSMFGMEIDATRLLGMRLAEHALHSWDVAVVFDDRALLAPDATELIVDTLDALVSRAGRPESEPLSVSVVASSPARHFVLDAAAVSLSPGEAVEGSPRLELSSEALVRLVYGRLDDRHVGTPVPKVTGIDLDRLRAIFPGV